MAEEKQKMSANAFEEQYYDEYEHYNMEDDKHYPGNSRKGRSKAEAGKRSDPSTNTWTVYGKLETESNNRAKKNAAKNQSSQS